MLLPFNMCQLYRNRTKHPFPRVFWSTRKHRKQKWKGRTVLGSLEPQGSLITPTQLECSPPKTWIGLWWPQELSYLRGKKSPELYKSPQSSESHQWPRKHGFRERGLTPHVWGGCVYLLCILELNHFLCSFWCEVLEVCGSDMRYH